jgi:hypothetical protein
MRPLFCDKDAVRQGYSLRRDRSSVTEKRVSLKALPGYWELDARASEALETARDMPQGIASLQALKAAGKLRVTAEKVRLANERSDGQIF